MASDPTTAGPAGDPDPALVAIIRAWHAEHADQFSHGYFEVGPGEIDFWAIEAVRMLKPRISDEATNRTVKGIHESVDRITYWPEDVAFGAMPLIYHPLNTDPDNAIALDDPDAAAKIADRVRTADDLRAELALAYAERDALRAKHDEIMRRLDQRFPDED